MISRPANRENPLTPDSLCDEPPCPEVDSLKMQYLNQFIALCRQKGIVTVLVISPKYTIARPGFYAALEEVARQNGVPLLDYHTAGLYHDHSEYFKDTYHLWDDGARHYSSVFASDLKQLLMPR